MTIISNMLERCFICLALGASLGRASAPDQPQIHQKGRFTVTRVPHSLPTLQEELTPKGQPDRASYSNFDVLEPLTRAQQSVQEQETPLDQQNAQVDTPWQEGQAFTDEDIQAFLKKLEQRKKD